MGKDLGAAFSQFFKDVSPNKWQFIQISLMTFLIGATVSICKMTQALMTGKDEDNDGKVDKDEGEWIVSSKLQSTQFLVAFGISKALANLFVGITSDIFGRKVMMVIGWIFGLVIPFMVIFAGNWETVVASNVFLGIQQGVCWTLAIIYMIDYAGPRNRAFTIGINETIGYTSVAIFGVISASMVNDKENDYREDPYYMLVAFIAVCLLMSIFTVKENRQQVLDEHKKRTEIGIKAIEAQTQKELPVQKKPTQISDENKNSGSGSEDDKVIIQENQQTVVAITESMEPINKQPKQIYFNEPQVSKEFQQQQQEKPVTDEENKKLLSKELETAYIVWPDQSKQKHSVFRLVFIYSSFLNTNLMVCNLVGLMINFLTAFAWGIFTKWMKTYGGDNWEEFSKETTANVILCYAIPKGVLQFFFGFFSDRYGRKKFVTFGIIINIIALLVLTLSGKYMDNRDDLLKVFYTGSFLLGFGTSVMYPNALAASTENTLPITRASSLGTYRFWRDSGYWIGGLFMGAIADAADIPFTIGMAIIFVFIVLVLWVAFYDDKERVSGKDDEDKIQEQINSQPQNIPKTVEVQE